MTVMSVWMTIGSMGVPRVTVHSATGVLTAAAAARASLHFAPTDICTIARFRFTHHSVAFPTMNMIGGIISSRTTDMSNLPLCLSTQQLLSFYVPVLTGGAIVLPAPTPSDDDIVSAFFPSPTSHTVNSPDFSLVATDVRPTVALMASSGWVEVISRHPNFLLSFV
jgi:hypothetical protein